MYEVLEVFFLLIIIYTIGMITSFMQKIIVYKTKDNVTLNTGVVILEISITLTGLLFIFLFTSDLNNSLISDQCSKYQTIDTASKIQIDKVFGLLNPQPG